MWCMYLKQRQIEVMRRLFKLKICREDPVIAVPGWIGGADAVKTMQMKVSKKVLKENRTTTATVLLLDFSAHLKFS